MRIGQTDIDFEAHQINGPAGRYSVEPMVMQVLSILVENAGQVVTRESLIDKVWGVGYGGDERLSRAISLLRKSFGDTRGKHEHIQTIPKTGYMFAFEVEGVEHNDNIDQGRTSTAKTVHRPPKKKLKNGLAATILTVVIALAALIYFGRNIILPSPVPEPPLVMIMDSAHPARIYDAQVRSEGGTNADILSDILADLPIRTQKELIYPDWNRFEAVTQFNPALIVVHYSGFKQEDSRGNRPQLRLLIEYFRKTETKFLIYSRADSALLDGNMDIILKKLYTEYPDMRTRVNTFPMLEYGEPKWKDQASAQGIKLKVKEILQLE